MSFSDSTNRPKRIASSPLSEGEDNDSLNSRRSRMKRINLAEVMDEQGLPPDGRGGGKNGGPESGAAGLNTVPLSTLSDLNGESTETDSKTKIEEKVTLESLSGKIDQILGYLATNKDELSTINRRHEKRFQILEKAYNDVVDNFNQASNDISSNASQIARNSTNIESNEACISTVKAQLRICKASNEEYISKFKDMELEIKNLRSEFVENKRAVLDLGLETREQRLALSGVIEKDKEDPITAALDAVNKILTHAVKKTKSEAKSTSVRLRFRVLKLADIDNAYRVGQQKRKGSRTIIIAFSFIHIRQMVLSSKPYLKDLDVKYFLNEDLSQITRDFRANLKVIAEGGKNLGHDTKVTGNKIIINSETYQPDEISAICPTILYAANREKLLEDGIAFRGDRSIFSNFFPSPIIIDDVDYANVEQFFQHEKAVQCGADTQARKIMSKSNPWYIKSVGSRVEPKEGWIKNRVPTLYKGIFAKFEQNLPLRQALQNSRGLNLYEATTDLFFACGIDLDSPKWATKDWQGQNVTGKVLMKVRGEFLAEESLSESISDNTLLNLTSTDEVQEESPQRPQLTQL